MKTWLVYKEGMDCAKMWQGTEEDAKYWRELGYEVEEA